MSHIPTRTGLKSITHLLHKVCNLIVKFRVVMSHFMTEAQLAKIDELYAVCQDVTAMIEEIFSEA